MAFGGRLLQKLERWTLELIRDTLRTSFVRHDPILSGVGSTDTE